MSYPHNESCQSPVTVTENRIYLNGEPWVLAREADLPTYVEWQADSPKSPTLMLNYASGPLSPGQRGRDSLFRSSSLVENSPKMPEFDSAVTGYHDWQRISELESPCPLHPSVSKTNEEPHISGGTGPCQRLHLSDPHLCKKIVQKARRAFSKLGRKPGSKAFGNSDIPLAIHQDSISFTDSVLDTNTHLDGSSEAAPSELCAANGTAHELPAEEAAANCAAVYEAPSDVVVRQKPRHTTSGYYTDIVSPESSFGSYYGSGSSISDWKQSPWQTSSSSRYSSNTEDSGFVSPIRRLSELDGSSSSPSPFVSFKSTGNTSHGLPVIGESAPPKAALMPAGLFARPRLDVDVNAHTGSFSCQKQQREDSFMDNGGLCASPTSVLRMDGFSDGPVEGEYVHEHSPRDRTAYKSAIHEVADTASSSDDVIMLEEPWWCTSTSRTQSVRDSDPSEDCRIAMPLCPCHELPMRPDMDLSDLVAGAKGCGVTSPVLVQDDQITLGGRIQSMFTLLLELALQKLDAFEPEVRTVLFPTFKVPPTLQASLEALDNLHVTQSFTGIHELVSLVFTAFSIAILTVDEDHLSQYTSVMYIDITLWLNALSSPADKQAFAAFLEVLWLPQIRYSAAPFRQREFCPFTIPKGVSTQDWKSSPLSNYVGLGPGITVRLCLYYFDLIHHAAEDEVAAGFCSDNHFLAKNPPPLFVDSAMTYVVKPYLTGQVSEAMKDIASSTARVLRNGQLSSFNEVDAHLRTEVVKRRGHFGSYSSSSSDVFSAMCQNAAILFARRKLAWFVRTLQDSANRVVSQTWAEGVHERVGDMRTRSAHSSETFAIDSQNRSRLGLEQPDESIILRHSPSGLSKSTATQRTGRRQKVSQDALPSRCTKCTRIFEGKCRRDHLRRHLKTVHDSRYITCHLCGKTLKDRSDNFAKHLNGCYPRHGP